MPKHIIDVSDETTVGICTTSGHTYTGKIKNCQIEKLWATFNTFDGVKLDHTKIKSAFIKASSIEGMDVTTHLIVNLAHICNTKITKQSMFNIFSLRSSIIAHSVIEDTLFYHGIFSRCAFINVVFHKCIFSVSMFKECSFSKCTFNECEFIDYSHSAWVPFKKCDFNPQSVLGPMDYCATSYPHYTILPTIPNQYINCPGIILSDCEGIYSLVSIKGIDPLLQESLNLCRTSALNKPVSSCTIVNTNTAYSQNNRAAFRFFTGGLQI